MRKIRIIKGKKWQVNIDDTFTGETIQIDGYLFNIKHLKESEYLEIEKVKEIINGEKELYKYSQV